MMRLNLKRALVFCACVASLCASAPSWSQPTNTPPAPEDARVADMGADMSADMGAAPATPQPAAVVSVAQRLNEAFSQVEALQKVTASFDKGVVTLRGETTSPSMRDQAQALAQRMDGVLLVNNLIIVDTPAVSGSQADANSASANQASSRDEAIELQLRSVFAQVPELNQLQVNVRSGVVSLRGQVANLELGQRAEALAQKLDGVAFVNNQLEVSTDISMRISPAWLKMQSLWNGLISRLPLLVVGLLILALALWGSKRISQLKGPFKRLDDRPLLGELVRQIIRTVIVIGGLLFVLELFGITSLVGAVLGTAGVAGVALGFAFRDIVENYLASILLSIRHPFRKGDFVKVGDYEGKVTRMTTRDTVLMSIDGNHLRVPNAYVFKSIICNYTLNPMRRFDFVVGVGNGESLSEVKRLALEALTQVEGILPDPAPYMIIDDLGDFSVLCHFYGWVDQGRSDLFGVRSEAIRRVKLAMDEAQIDLPEPIARRVMYQPPSASRAVHPKDDPSHALLDQEANPQSHLDRQVAQDDSTNREEDLLG